MDKMYENLIEFAGKTNSINQKVKMLRELSSVLDTPEVISRLRRILAETELDARADFEKAIKAQDEPFVANKVNGDGFYLTAIIRTYLDCVVVISRWSRIVYWIDVETGQLTFKHFSPHEELMLESEQSWSEVSNPIPF